MFHLLNALAGIASIYQILIFIRIILTWFPGFGFGSFYFFLCAICDPYLNWFRRFRFTRRGVFDFSAIIAVVVLSLVNRVLKTWARMGGMRAGIVLALVLNSVWNIFLWFGGFFIIVLVIRLVAYLVNANIYSPFWHFVDLIAQPVMYRICRIFFPTRFLHYLARIIISIFVLAVLVVTVGALVSMGTFFLANLPV
ncbi:MAG: YggT family protein [Treponema sp.]|jgi:YggT family protein|nr:YggT family protein [Treponema sp.]